MLLVCDRCGASIPAGARFCPTCADPVTEADVVAGRPVVATERVQLVCPKCRRLALHAVPGNGSATVVCPACQQPFQTQVVRIRSKNSRGSRKTNTRDFTVRAQDLAARDLLFEFRSPGWDDFELRSRDLAAFNRVDGTLRGVQNLTLERYLALPAPPQFGLGCALALLILLALFVRLCSAFNSAISTSSSPAYAPAPTSAAGETPVSTETYYVQGELNIRSAPRRDAHRVRTLARGDGISLGPRDANGWAPVYAANGQVEGYVYARSGLLGTMPPLAPAKPRTEEEPARSAERRTGSSSRGYYTGPRGGCYTYSASGRKRYVDHSYCY